MFSRLFRFPAISSASRISSSFSSSSSLTFSRQFHQSKLSFAAAAAASSSSSNASAPRILVTGATGQIGCELVGALRTRYGISNVIASDIKNPSPDTNFSSGPFLWADVMNYDILSRIVVENKITWIIHLASLLSAVGEKNPQMAMKLNTRGIENILELARIHNCKVFAPSTIAVFGSTSPKELTPDLTIMRPSTIYGVTKVYLELLGEYYYNKFGVDFRSVRYPGIISNLGMPGGGTTDYAVEIYHEAVKSNSYQCFLNENTRMPMLYMPDCINAVIQLMETPREKLNHCTYNITGFSFTPDELTKSIQKHSNSFKTTYKPDFRQSIADSWPKTLDDQNARMDWNWNPKYTVDSMTKDMLMELSKKYGKNFGK